MEATDFLLDEDGDLIIKDGDFATGLSDQDHIENILTANKGAYRLEPLIGVGLQKAINGPDTGVTRQRLKKRTRLNLELDNYRVTAIEIKTLANMKIEATRIR